MCEALEALLAVVIVAERAGIGTGALLQGQTSLMVSMNLVTSEACWKFI